MKENDIVLEEVQGGEREDDLAGHGDQQEQPITHQLGQPVHDHDSLAAFGYAFVMYFI